MRADFFVVLPGGNTSHFWEYFGFTSSSKTSSDMLEGKIDGVKSMFGSLRGAGKPTIKCSLCRMKVGICSRSISEQSMSGIANRTETKMLIV